MPEEKFEPFDFEEEVQPPRDSGERFARIATAAVLWSLLILVVVLILGGAWRAGTWLF